MQAAKKGPFRRPLSVERIELDGYRILLDVEGVLSYYIEREYLMRGIHGDWILYKEDPVKGRVRCDKSRYSNDLIDSVARCVYEEPLPNR